MIIFRVIVWVKIYPPREAKRREVSHLPAVGFETALGSWEILSAVPNGNTARRLEETTVSVAN